MSGASEGAIDASAARSGAARRLALLLAFYFVQGLPVGFQAMVLPVFLARAGVPHGVVTMTGALAAPWGLKILFAPFVDAAGSARFGRRRSVILPMQLAMAATCVLASRASPEEGLGVFLGAVLALNLCAAIMDVAVDGLAVELLAPRELGYGNAAQVAGFKLGMVTVGGLLLMWSAEIGLDGIFLGMGALCLVGAVASLVLPSNESRCASATLHERGDGAGHEARIRVRAILALLRTSLRAPAWRWVLLFIATYKAGESIADVLFRLFLVDAGFTDRQIGLWVSSYGMAASIAGSVLGGVLASRWSPLKAIAATALLRAFALALELWVVMALPSDGAVIAVTIAQHAFGGALTAAMFAFMMSRVDRRIGGTHFTLLATVEVLGKGLFGWFAGHAQEALGYAPVYALALALSVAFLGLLPPIARLTEAAPRVDRAP